VAVDETIEDTVLYEYIGKLFGIVKDLWKLFKLVSGSNTSRFAGFVHLFPK
jgi:hypothetical protein